MVSADPPCAPGRAGRFLAKNQDRAANDPGIVTENKDLIVDGLQYCNWSRRIFEDMRDGGVTTVHVTLCYWEDFRETVARIAE